MLKIMKKDVTHIPICRRSVEKRLSRTLKMTLPYVLNSDFPALPLGHGEHAHVNYLACRGKVRRCVYIHATMVPYVCPPNRVNMQHNVNMQHAR